ncbi:MAG TPA: hypothetical protein VNM22_01765 [Candidatus Limnocylindrales bacterium]|nr:hypothetical protein [Candidatus Limnocylindrales bacterium]
MQSNLKQGGTGHIYRVDKFVVPNSARDEFMARVKATHEVLRKQRGFVQDILLEQFAGPGEFNFVTIVEWESLAHVVVNELSKLEGGCLGMTEGVDDHRPVLSKVSRNLPFSCTTTAAAYRMGCFGIIILRQVCGRPTRITSPNTTIPQYFSSSWNGWKNIARWSMPPRAAISKSMFRPVLLWQM